MVSKRSICTQGEKVTYYWRDCSSGDYIAETAEKVVSVIKEQGYLLNGVLEADCEAQIEERLEQAELGRLKPVDHVKQVRRDPALEMFEIRWEDIAATRVKRASGLYEDAIVLMRLYHVEENSSRFIGLLVHEKVIGKTEEETTALQNEKIDAAIYMCHNYAGIGWGIPELAPQSKK